MTEKDWSPFDFDINGRFNGVFLPSDDELAVATGLAKHDGLGGGLHNHLWYGYTEYVGDIFHRILLA